MKFIELISKNKLDEARQEIFNCLDSIVAKRLEEKKKTLSADIYEVEEINEAGPVNVIKIGRIKRIKRRIRRNAKGKIVVQRNVRRSAIKGYRISGNTVKRIPAMQRIQKARKLKRYWKTKGRAKLKRTLLKRKMSLRRRKSMGLR